VHRAVTNPDRARLSVATFHDPAKTVELLLTHLIRLRNTCERRKALAAVNCRIMNGTGGS